MSDDILVRVEGVSKKFCRTFKRSLWYGVQDLATELRGRPVGNCGTLRTDEFWAVQDVSFELKRGECLGLIGRNGAGKTTLLRMLNGLIKPDTGRIEIHGQVGALIALGAGFNPVLTGRENIYINAAILGLSKKEIDAKLNEIIEFAELEEFIDSPVQNYSSGMTLRLGFSIASTLKPTLLLLDEILAVGDAPFRAKCYRRISSAIEDAAVILVSHNLEQIAQVCSRIMLLSIGSCIYDGDIIRGIQLYNDSISRDQRQDTPSNISHTIISKYVTINSAITYSQLIPYGGNLRISLDISFLRSVREMDIKITLFNTGNTVVAESYTRTNDTALTSLTGRKKINISVGPLFLPGRIYSASIVLLERNTNEHLYWGVHTLTFQSTGPPFGSGDTIPPISVTTSDNFVR